MTGAYNADVECSENKVEGEDSWRRVDCLRGRLLAERMASKNAREEAHQLGIRLLEVDRLLEQERKSRKRAEKRLKFLMKRFQSIIISSAVSTSTEEVEILQKQMTKSLDMEESNYRSQVCSWSVSESTCSLLGSNENSSDSRTESCVNGGDDVDNSMALVPVETSSENERVDPEILDATVKQVLESLRRAKEQLQSSMGRRRMIQVG